MKRYDEKGRGIFHQGKLACPVLIETHARKIALSISQEALFKVALKIDLMFCFLSAPAVRLSSSGALTSISSGGYRLLSRRTAAAAMPLSRMRWQRHAPKVRSSSV